MLWPTKTRHLWLNEPAARAYGGRIFTAVAAVERKPRGTRAVDLLIASAGLPLYTRNGDDFIGLTSLIEVVVV